MPLSRQTNQPGRLVLFDLDQTLLAADTNSLWLDFLADRGYLDKNLVNREQQRWYVDYLNGCLDFEAYMRFQLEPLRDIPVMTLLTLRDLFSRDRLAPNIAPGAAELIRGHHDQGHLCVVVTATHSFLAEPVAQLVGIGQLIATDAEQVNGSFTGHPGKMRCFGKGKIAAVEQWLEKTGLAGTLLDKASFYSDSSNDLPLLERVANPVAVDPDDQLHTIATQRGWPVISLRHSSAAVFYQVP